MNSIETSLKGDKCNRLEFDDKTVEIEVPFEKQENQVTQDITWTTAVSIQKVHQNIETFISDRPGVKPESGLILENKGMHAV